MEIQYNFNLKNGITMVCNLVKVDKDFTYLAHEEETHSNYTYKVNAIIETSKFKSMFKHHSSRIVLGAMVKYFDEV